MDRYTASNGVTVKTGNHVGIVVKDGALPNTVIASKAHENALREFFRAEEDERLGRWRWPDSPRYIVRRSDFDETYSYVFDEETFELWGINGFEDDTRDVPAIARDAARAYFDAHPEPKPAWHDAKPGEIWALGIGGGYHGHSITVVEVDGEPRFIWHVGGDNGLRNIPVRDRTIDYGRRVWPEEAS